MYTKNEAYRRLDRRGPRYAVVGSLRPEEARTEYADTGEAAEEIREEFEERGYYQVGVWPPEGSIHLGPLAAARRKAQEGLDEATSILRAAVLRALESGRAEAEVARQAGLSRTTVRDWAGK